MTREEFKAYIDIIDSFRMVEKFVNDNQDNYKGNIFYKFSKFINGEEVI